MDRKHVHDLIAEDALVRDTMTMADTARIREEMERAEAKRLQPFHIQSFFLEAFKHLGGRIRPDGRMRSAHARSKRPDLMRARKVSTACPPGMRHRMPERFSLCVTRVLQAASTTPEPMVRPCSFMSWYRMRLRCFRKKASSRSISARFLFALSRR